MKFDNFKASRDDHLSKYLANDDFDYIRKAIRAMRLVETEPNLGLISLIFGFDSKLTKDDFFKQLVKK